jgi:acyl carrier protein
VERLSKQGFKPIPLDKGLAALNRILSVQVTQLSVIPCDWRKYLSQFTWENLLFAHFAKAHTPAKPQSQPASGEFLQRLKQAAAKERHHLLTKFVSDTVQQVIGLDTLSGVTEKPLRDLGMDSLMAVEIRNRLGKGLEASLPVSLLFNYPTLGDVVGYLEKEVVKVEAVVGEAVVEEKSFEFLDGLSQEELEKLINLELENG